MISFIAAVMCSCSPVAYDELDDNRNYISIDSGYEIEAEDDGTDITIRFAIIPEAKRYGYGSSEEDITVIPRSSLKFEDGYYAATLDRKTLLSAGNEFRMYASTLSDGDSWIYVSKFSVEINIDNISPALTASSRKSDSVILSAVSEAYQGNMTYKAEYGSSYKEFTSSSLPYTLEGIGTDSVTLKISHKITGTDSFSENTQELIIGKYDASAANINVSIDDEASITVTGVPDVYSYIALYDVSGSTPTPMISKPYASSVTFSSSEFNGYYSGKLRVGGYINEPDEDAKVVTNDSYEYTTGFDTSSAAIGKQSYKATIAISPYMTDKVFTVAVKNGTETINSVVSSVSDNVLSISVSDLESRSDYSMTVSNGSSANSITFTTRSFAGTYEWEASSTKSGNYATQFAVTVKEAPSDSNLNYYVYPSARDISYEAGDEELRISPLYDPSADPSDKLPDGGISGGYDKLPAAYRWNNEKWNSSEYKPHTLQSITDTTESKDKTSSTVVSKAKAFGFDATATTLTSIEFKENSDGTCYMIFYNQLQGSGIATSEGNKALYKNPSPNSAIGETSEYHYALKLVD